MAISLIFPIDTDLSDPSSSSNSQYGLPSFSDLNPVEAIKQNLKMLLLTRQGEYVMDANFGVGLRDYLFEQTPTINTSDIESAIRLQVSSYMPYLEIKNITTSLEEDLVMHLKIDFSYNNLATVEFFEIQVS